MTGEEREPVTVANFFLIGHEQTNLHFLEMIPKKTIPKKVITSKTQRLVIDKNIK